MHGYTSGCSGHGERGHIGGTGDQPVLEAQCHGNVVAFTAQAFAFGVAVVVIEDVLCHDGGETVLASPASDGQAALSELLADLDSGFEGHVAS